MIKSLDLDLVSRLFKSIINLTTRSFMNILNVSMCSCSMREIIQNSDDLLLPTTFNFCGVTLAKSDNKICHIITKKHFMNTQH